MKAKYTVIPASHVDRQLVQHIQFITRVSVKAARTFRDEFEKVLDKLEENPLEFPFDTDPNLPSELYHKAIFAKWYKALFIVEGNIVYLDAVVDCRQSTDSYGL